MELKGWLLRKLFKLGFKAINHVQKSNNFIIELLNCSLHGSSEVKSDSLYCGLSG